MYSNKSVEGFILGLPLTTTFASVALYDIHMLYLGRGILPYTLSLGLAIWLTFSSKMKQRLWSISSISIKKKPAYTCTRFHTSATVLRRACLGCSAGPCVNGCWFGGLPYNGPVKQRAQVQLKQGRWLASSPKVDLRRWKILVLFSCQNVGWGVIYMSRCNYFQTDVYLLTLIR